jgi:hypothetical protein
MQKLREMGPSRPGVAAGGGLLSSPAQAVGHQMRLPTW